MSLFVQSFIIFSGDFKTVQLSASSNAYLVLHLITLCGKHVCHRVGAYQRLGNGLARFVFDGACISEIVAHRSAARSKEGGALLFSLLFCEDHEAETAVLSSFNSCRVSTGS